MSSLAYLGIAVGLSVLGLTILALARSRPRSMQAGMEAFSRELQALAPADTHVLRHEAHIDNVQPANVNARHTVDRQALDQAGDKPSAPQVPAAPMSAERSDRAARAARRASRSVKPDA